MNYNAYAKYGIEANIKNNIFSQYMQDCDNNVYEIVEASFEGWTTKLTIREICTGKIKSGIDAIELVPLKGYFGIIHTLPELGHKDFQFYRVDIDAVPEQYCITEIIYVDRIAENIYMIISKNHLYICMYIPE